MSQLATNSQSSGQPAPPETDRGGFGKYVWIAFVVVALTQGGAVAFRWWLIPSAARPMRHSLSELPRKFGGWTAQDVELDPRIFVKLGANDDINRSYTNAAGQEIAMNCATWLSTDPGMPHAPDLCYFTAGWRLEDSRIVPLSGRPVSVAAQTYTRAGAKIVVLFWFQMDERAFSTWNGGRDVRRSYFGRREWPPLTKILLQTDATERGEAGLLELASSIYDFNCTL